jgi:ABC-type lipoprotein release transport system permease subunit
MNVGVIAAVTGVLAAVALVATAIPALRASRINPVVVLGK